VGNTIPPLSRKSKGKATSQTRGGREESANAGDSVRKNQHHKTTKKKKISNACPATKRKDNPRKSVKKTKDSRGKKQSGPNFHRWFISNQTGGGPTWRLRDGGSRGGRDNLDFV